MTGVRLFLCLILASKVLVALQLQNHPLLQPDTGLDTTAYVGLARDVLAGNLALGPGLYYLSPLYIYFLAGLLALFDSFTVVRLIQVGLGTLAVWCLWLTTREWFNDRAAWAAALTAALTGLFTFYESLILQAAIDPVLTSAALLALARGLRRDSARWLAAAGLMFGIASLNRPNVLMAAGLIALVPLAARRWRHAALLTAGLAAGLAPVAIRNVVVAGQWTLVSSHGGLNFLIGNGEGATGFYRALPDITPNIIGQQEDVIRVASRALGREVTEAEASDYLFDRAWTWIGQHPGEALWLFVRKLGWVFHAQHIALPHSYPFYVPGTALRAMVVGPWVLIPLGIVGLVVAAPARDRASYLVWLTFVPAYALAVAAFFVAERYRLPLLVPLCIGTGAFVDYALREVARRRTARLAMPAAGAVLLLIAANRPTALSDGREDETIRMAERLIATGRAADAEAWIATHADDQRDPARLHFHAGRQYLESGDRAAAIRHLRRASELRPGAVEYALLLAETLRDAGDAAGAAAALAGLSPGPAADVETWLRLGRLAMQLKAPEVAQRFFEYAARAAPASADARLQYGLNLLTLKRNDDARRELAEAVRLEPRNADALAHLAYAELALGDAARAREHTLAALAIDSNNPMARQLDAILRR